MNAHVIAYLDYMLATTTWPEDWYRMSIERDLYLGQPIGNYHH